jgi:hypothetical protein
VGANKDSQAAAVTWLLEGASMVPTQVRGSALVATLAAVLLGWCAIRAPASGHYGLRASFDGVQLELRLALPALCVQVSAVLLEEVASLKSVSLCTHCGYQERSWS